MKSGNRPVNFMMGLAAVLFLLAVSGTAAEENGPCLGCHKKQFEQEIKKTFIHKPFLEKKCALCHSPDLTDYAAESDGKAIFPRNTKNLGSSENKTLIHLFAVPKDRRLTVIFIEAQSDDAEPYRAKVQVPPFAALDLLSSDDRPPGISNVNLIAVRKDRQASAVIQWHTDELSRTQLKLGQNQPERLAFDSDQFLAYHRVELHSLQPDTLYYFTIRSEDIYGNSKESRVYSFATDKSFNLEENGNIGENPAPLKLETDIFRSTDNYLVKIATSKPATVAISTYDLPGAPQLSNIPSVLPAEHPPLKNSYETNLILCDMCHRTLSEKFPHTVHFLARLGSYIPADYPRLPKDQISCLTCHDHHASENVFLLRKSSDRALCIGCHKRPFGG